MFILSNNDSLALLFPEGFFYNDETIGTTKNAIILGVFEKKYNKKSTLVSEGGLEPP